MQAHQTPLKEKKSGRAPCAGLIRMSGSPRTRCVSGDRKSPRQGSVKMRWTT